MKTDQQGFYGNFGGAFVPELLRRNLKELEVAFKQCQTDPQFDRAFRSLLETYSGRPTPLYFANRLSEYLGYNIWLKREDLNHTGAHKINNALGQILLAHHMRKTRIIAETGAGQHGVAVATACALKGLECTVYMGARDMKRQAPNVARMRMLGANVVPVSQGSQTLKDATNEAIRDWINNPSDTHYIIGSAVGPHPYPALVAFFQSVISKELCEQCRLQMPEGQPGALIACLGGGSNAVGCFYHYIDGNVRLITAEAAGLGIDSGATAATSFVGSRGVLHGCMTLLMQTDDGQIVEPHSVSAGLDYPGIGPLCAHLIETGRVESYAVTDQEALEAAVLLSRIEGIIPALESAHALALLTRLPFSGDRHVVVNLSGRGDKDMQAYTEHMSDFTPNVQPHATIS